MTAVLQTYLSWNLVSPVEYVAGQDLTFALGITAPKTGKYYLLGALYDTNLNYISGTLFGVAQPEVSDYAANDAYSSLWGLEADGKIDLSCRFAFSRTDAVLGLFLMRMVGDSSSLDDDEQIVSASASLSSPAPPVTWESIMLGAITITFIGVIMNRLFKER